MTVVQVSCRLQIPMLFSTVDIQMTFDIRWLCFCWDEFVKCIGWGFSIFEFMYFYSYVINLWDFTHAFSQTNIMLLFIIREVMDHIVHFLWPHFGKIRFEKFDWIKSSLKRSQKTKELGKGRWMWQNCWEYLFLWIHPPNDSCIRLSMLVCIQSQTQLNKVNHDLSFTAYTNVHMLNILWAIVS